MSEVRQTGGVVTDDQRNRFLDLKNKLADLFVPTTSIKFRELFELWDYLSGKFDPTPNTSAEEFRSRIARLETFWMMFQPKG